MENPGEHLVGQYLREVKKCDFIEYNLQTKFVQGEIDVVGINSSDKIVYICEVATHLETGLQYTKNNQPDNVDKLVKKFEKDIQYAKNNFKEFKHVFMFWTPIIKIPKKDTKHNQLNDINQIVSRIYKSTNVKIEVIYNQKFYECIQELRQKASITSQAMSSPIMRFLQIEEKLNDLLHKKKK